MQTNNILPIEEIDPEFATLIKQVANKELPAIVFNDKVFKESSNWVLEVFPILNENINNFFFGYTAKIPINLVNRRTLFSLT